MQLPPMNQWLPTLWSNAIQSFIGLIALQLVRPIVCVRGRVDDQTAHSRAYILSGHPTRQVTPDHQRHHHRGIRNHTSRPWTLFIPIFVPYSRPTQYSISWPHGPSLDQQSYTNIEATKCFPSPRAHDPPQRSHPTLTDVRALATRYLLLHKSFFNNPALWQPAAVSHCM